MPEPAIALASSIHLQSSKPISRRLFFSFCSYLHLVFQVTPFEHVCTAKFCMHSFSLHLTALTTVENAYKVQSSSWLSTAFLCAVGLFSAECETWLILRCLPELLPVGGVYCYSYNHIGSRSWYMFYSVFSIFAHFLIFKMLQWCLIIRFLTVGTITMFSLRLYVIWCFWYSEVIMRTWVSTFIMTVQNECKEDNPSQFISC
jgi:hypothetical protein